MGIYLNPGNSGFVEITNGDYIDKTGMIELINAKINTPKKLICVSRPRRFGKSYAAQMLCAYMIALVTRIVCFINIRLLTVKHIKNT